MNDSPLIDLRNVPDWARGLIGCVVISSCVIAIIGTIMVLSHLTHGPNRYQPPPTCGGSGVRQVINEASNDNVDWDYAVVCNNGRTWYVR